MARYAIAALAPLLALTGCTGETRADAKPGTGWERITSPPLSPRAAAATFSHDGDAFVVGGDTEPCPPNVQCVTPKTPPLADGAAYDAESGTWRKIADAPVPFEFAEVEVVGGTAYLWITAYGRPGTRTAFLAYRIVDDRWDELPRPASGVDQHGIEIAQAEGRVVALSWTNAGEVVPELILDPATERWERAPSSLDVVPYPAPPRGDIPPHRVAGWIGRYSAPAGLALDEETGRWIEIERLDEGDDWVDRRAVASAGRDLLVFGGVRWGERLEPRLLDDAWLWRAPTG